MTDLDPKMVEELIRKDIDNICCIYRTVGDAMFDEVRDRLAQRITTRLTTAQRSHVDGCIEEGVFVTTTNTTARQQEKVSPVVFSHAAWEDGERVITANGNPIGQTVNAKSAQSIVNWVASAWAELIKANALAACPPKTAPEQRQRGGEK